MTEHAAPLTLHGVHAVSRWLRCRIGCHALTHMNYSAELVGTGDVIRFTQERWCGDCGRPLKSSERAHCSECGQTLRSATIPRDVRDQLADEVRTELGKTEGKRGHE